MASSAGGAYAPDRKRKGRGSAHPSSSAVAVAAATASAPSEPELAGPYRKMVDYSVWDHIEVSDDEDETHPNIDTASLFRWRHQVERACPAPSPLPGLRSRVLVPYTSGDPPLTPGIPPHSLGF